MLVAENSLQEKCFISKLTVEEIKEAKKKKWYCPSCHTQVIIKHGKINKVHFAHKSKISCAFFSENESWEHLKGKELLMTNCEKYDINYELEAFIPKLKQRPDILLKNKIAIEFQCSSLNVERFKERTESYITHGYQVIWIVGKNFHLKEKLSALQKQFIYFSNQVGFYLWELDVEKEEVMLDYFIVAVSSKLYFNQKKFQLSQFSMIDILIVPNTVVEQKRMTDPAINYYEQQCLWNRQLNQKQKGVMSLQAFFYEKGQNLRQIEKRCFYPSFLTPLLMEEELILRCLTYDYFLMYKEGSAQEIMSYLTKEYQFSSFSLVESHTLLGYCLSLYLCFLKEKNIIQSTEKGTYSLSHPKEMKEEKWEILWLPLKYGMISK